MHELSIATSVLAIACRHAAAAVGGDGSGAHITRVDLKIGHLRQVVPSALAFSFELVAQGTPADGAELRMEMVPAAGLCRSCGVESTLEAFPLQCRACESFDLDMIRGEELIVEALEIEEAERGAYSH